LLGLLFDPEVEAADLFKGQLTFAGLQSVISQKTDLLEKKLQAAYDVTLSWKSVRVI
jgi:hypothetical protein